MLTSNPFSTISYNSENFLKKVLQDLEKQHIIDEWYFIHHKGETDFYTGEREKDHFHVFLNPTKRVDTDALRDHFNELDPNNPKPLGVMPFRTSKLNDWIMYGVHDEYYLHCKGEEKEYHYSWKDIKGYDDEAIKRAVKQASAHAYKELRRRETVSEHGVVACFNAGILKVNEVLGYIAIERQAHEQVYKKLSKLEFIDDKYEHNPFTKEKGEEKNVKTD